MFKSVNSRNQSILRQENRMEEYLEQCFKKDNYFTTILTQGAFGNVWKHFFFVACDKYASHYSIYWLGVKEAVMYPTKYRTTPRTK